MIDATNPDIVLPKPKQWELLGLVPLFAGLYWLLAGQGGSWLIWALVPGALLLTSGASLLLIPGNPRITGYMAIGGGIGALLSLFAMFAGGFATGMLCLIGSVASFLVAGRAGAIAEPLYKGAPAPEFSMQLDFKAALDQFVLGYFLLSGRLPDATIVPSMCEQIRKLEEICEERGWHKDPSGFHPAPSAPDQTSFETGRIFGQDYDILRFDSGFSPEDSLPGAAIWKGHTRNNRCEVRVMRHEGKRPWLLCIHGYRMGWPIADFGLFDPRVLHHKLGLNIVQPVLPLHGSRRIGPQSGDQFLDWDLLDLVYAEAQTLWDLRRTIAWIRAQEPDAQIGVLGYSLGGYNASLLAAYEKNLDFVIAGIPVTDFANALWRYIPYAHRQYLIANGLNEKRYRDLLRVVSPLDVQPLPPKDRLFIYGGTTDLIVPPSHLIALSKHWDVPVRWYQGSHLSVRREYETRETIREAMNKAGWSIQR